MVARAEPLPHDRAALAGAQLTGLPHNEGPCLAGAQLTGLPGIEGLC